MAISRHLLDRIEPSECDCESWEHATCHEPEWAKVGMLCKDAGEMCGEFERMVREHCAILSITPCHFANEQHKWLLTANCYHCKKRIQIVGPTMFDIYECMLGMFETPCPSEGH